MTPQSPAVRAQIVVDVEQLSNALRGIWDALTEAVKPMVAAFQGFAQAYVRYNASTPEAKARRELDAALDWSEDHLADRLNLVRADLLRGVEWFAFRERLWAATTWGITEQDALDRAAEVMARRWQLRLHTPEQAAAVAVAILEGYSSRPAAWR